MKKFMSVIFVLILCCLPCTAYSADTDRIKTSDVSVNNNRLFDVEIGISSGKILTAATFTLEYNKDCVEFRDAHQAVSNSTIKATDREGKVTVIFLCGDGISLKKNNPLFTVKFKSVKSGKNNIKISAFDCVNGDIKNFSPPKSAVCNVAVTGKSSGTATGRTNRVRSAENIDNRSSDKNDSKESSVISKNTSGAIASVINSFLDNGSSSAVMWGVLLAAVVAACVFVAFIAGRNSKLKNNTQTKDNNDDNNKSDAD